jgi:hypothetical protein
VFSVKRRTDPDIVQEHLEEVRTTPADQRRPSAKTADTMTAARGGRAGSQTRICSFGRCRVVRLHYPPFGTRAGNPTRISSFGPKRHHALHHASLTNVEGMQRIEL